MEQINKKGASITILAQSFVVQAIMVSSTVLAQVQESFPEAGLTEIQMIMNLCMLASFPVTIIAGPLCNRVSKKLLSIIAMVFVTLGGVIPFTLHSSIYYMYASSVCIGVGMGLLTVLTPTLTTLIFHGDARSKMFGKSSAMQNIGSIIMMLLAGWLATFGWRNAYISFGLVLLALLMVIIFTPKMPIPAREAKKEPSVAKEKKAPIPGLAVAISIIMALWCCGYSTYVIYCSIFIDSTGIGGPSLAALTLSVGTIAGILGGVVFHKLLKAIRWHVITLASLLTALAYLAPALFPSALSVYIAGGVSGGTFAIALAGLNQIVSEVCTRKQVAGAMAFCGAATAAGSFFSPFVINPFSTLGIFSFAGPGSVFLASVVFMFCVMAASIIWIVYVKAKYRGLDNVKTPEDDLADEEEDSSALA